ncbi:two-component system sensor histidine kinase/response regulator [Actimicrobium sp. GrIS 1.19]|uniref:ATP-binding protein n=1 Tax=Actimicrobium sp. GrIS 1.19 TaxID=3071708 RepID=UPI002E0C4E36|nr:two-component system sensor histidine kinase/response regulator [Actimicrobium sp. GrIS 1.19]
MHRLPSGGVKRSVGERMQLLGFSPEEFAGLNAVLAATQAMKEVEKVAFAATQGFAYQSADGKFVDGEPRLDVASAMVHGDEYNLLKAELSHAVARLVAATESRTNKEVNLALQRLDTLIRASLACIIATIGLVLVVARVIQREVLQPIGRLSQAASALASGNYSARVVDRAQTQPLIETDRDFGVQELTALGVAVNGMAQAIEDDLQNRAAVQRQLELARVQSEDATRSKSMFLATMSHEIRTPMNAIIGMAWLALKTDLNTRQREYVNNIHTAAKSLLGIINNILDFSKVEAGKMELELTRFRLDEVIDQAVSLLQQSALDKDIDLLVEVDDLYAEIRDDSLLGDPLRLGQVLTNLLSNSIKFTERGSVRLSARVECHDADAMTLCFTLRDTGIGMDTPQLERLFTDFTQADGTTTRKYGGTGLGLAISRQFVALMGGRIWVESQPGVGSTFRFTARFALAAAALPMQPASAPACSAPILSAPILPAPQRSGDIAGMRILLVEDNPINQQLATELLAMRGVRVERASNGEEALERLAALPPTHYDAVLMDLQMPVMDGYEATRRLRASGRYRELVVIAMTAHALPDERLHCDAVGMNGHISKPIEPDALYAALARHHGRHSQDAAARLAVDSGPGRPTLDRRMGLRRTGGNMALHAHLAERFVHDYGGAPVELARLLAAQEWEQLERLIHTIKGLSGTLGGIALPPLGDTIEAASHAHDVAATTALLPEFSAALRALLDALSAVSAGPGMPAPPPTATGVSEWLPRLRRMLAECDSQAAPLWAEHKTDLDATLPPPLSRRISAAVDHFEFDKALALLPPDPTNAATRVDAIREDKTQ